MTEKPRTPEQAAAAAPISLPPGSFEHSELEKAGDAIVKAKPEERDALEAKKLGEIGQRVDEVTESGKLPGHKYVDREQVLVEGTRVKGEARPVGEIAVTERIQVFDPAQAAEEEAAAEEATAAVDVAGAGAPAPAAAGAKD